MTFKEKIESIKGKIQSKIAPDSTPEAIEEVNALVSELEALATDHDAVVTENAKFKDTIVRMVTTQGDPQPPLDDQPGSKTMTIEEAIERVSQGGK